MGGEAVWDMGVSSSSLDKGHQGDWEGIFESYWDPPQGFKYNRHLEITSYISK